jgi:hypothetical protein
MIRGASNVYHAKDLLGHKTLDKPRHYAKLSVDELKETITPCHPAKGRSQHGLAPQLLPVLSFPCQLFLAPQRR